MAKQRWWLLLGGLAWIVPSVQAWAQAYSSQEVTVGLEAQTWGNRYVTAADQLGTYHYLQYPTPSFTYTRNLSSTLALEGRVEPWTQFFTTNNLEAGHATLALGGVKAGWRGREWGFFGKTEAGIASWSCGAFVYDPNPYSHCSRITNFALEYGGVVERHLAGTFSLRVDAGHLLSTEFDHVLGHYQSGPVSAVPYRAGATLQHLDVRVGLTKSLGAPGAIENQDVPQRAAWDLGASFSLQPRDEIFLQVLSIYPSPTLWASWNFSEHVSWDTAVLRSGPYRAGASIDIGYHAGGRALQALTGAKIGLRRDRMGYFLKVRGGTLSFSRTLRTEGLLPNGSFFATDGMFTNLALDVGGVWEVYPTRHTLLRFDAGSATVFYQPKTVILSLPRNGVEVRTPFAVPEQTQAGLLLSFGGGFRF